MLRFNKVDQPWGQFVEPKINLPDVLRAQVKKAAGKHIMFSSVTDCYQPVEKEFGITGECLKILSAVDCKISILTKSALARRDADLVSQFKSFTFGMSASYHLDSTRLCFEAGTATIKQRAETMKVMKQAGARTWLFISPFLPGITQINPIIDIFGDSVDYVMLEAINLYSSTIAGLTASVTKAGFDFSKMVKLAKSPAFWSEKRFEFEDACKERNIDFEGLISHQPVDH